MRRLYPGWVADLDPDDAYRARREPTSGRPWLIVNMIASADGATAVNGVSGPLGNPADKRVFGLLRSLADVILVGSGTVRAEDYSAPRTTELRRRQRLDRGQAPDPRIAVVTASLDLDLSSALFADPSKPPLIITSASAPPDRVERASSVAEVMVAGDDRVELSRAMTVLFGVGASIVLAEGGPVLNGQLVAAGLVDELCLTMSPKLVAGTSARIAVGPELKQPVPMTLSHILEEDGWLFLRYVTPG